MVKAFYFSYDGLLDPLGQSQIVPYVSAISAAACSLPIVSYEKGERTKGQIKLMEIKVQKTGTFFAYIDKVHRDKIGYKNGVQNQC
jgi:hypothetical protein